MMIDLKRNLETTRNNWDHLIEKIKLTNTKV